MSTSYSKILRNRKHQIERRLDPKRRWSEQPAPMLSASNIHFEMAERDRAVNYGGIGAIHLMGQRLGLAEEIDGRVQLLKRQPELAQLATMHRDWKTQNIVVTGAASGLGRAICTHFIQLDANVRGIDINKEQLREVQVILGKKFIPVICDVANWDEVIQVFSQFPRIDVLVNSAGVTGQTNMKSYETDPADVEQVFRINFFGSYHTSKAVLPQMVIHGYGRLLRKMNRAVAMSDSLASQKC